MSWHSDGVLALPRRWFRHIVKIAFGITARLSSGASAFASVVVTSYAPVGPACSFFAAAALLATALAFFFVAFLPADFNFRVRMAFFCIEVRLVGMVIPLRKTKIS